MGYPGGKSGSGVYQTIINQMPPHSVYIEAFYGGGAVMKYKRPAIANIAIDRDAAALNKHRYWDAAYCADAMTWLLDMQVYIKNFGSYGYHNTLIYCDPPYLMSTRSSHRAIYKYEMDEYDHQRLLIVLASIARRGVMIMLSGYPSEMYDQALREWRRISYYTVTRGGSYVQECLWMSFPEPWELHDYRYLGRDFRERERIKRKKQRWVKRLKAMEFKERAALMQAIDQAKEDMRLNDWFWDRPTSPGSALLQEESHLVTSL